MGSSESKPEGERSQHVFASTTPLQFSSGLVDSLQSNPESDSTRERTRELHIQSRVSEELKRLQGHESQLLKDLEEKISQESGKIESPGDQLRDLGRESVQKEINSLRSKLEGRRQLAPLDKDLEKAKEDVVQCLRKNERRPLDCWLEVDTFKREVARLEKSFVERTLE